MKLTFRIDWGYQYLYSRRHYHPVYVWDGGITCENGEILNTWKLDYPVIWYGPGHCAKETLLPEARWESRTKRGIAGVKLEVEVTADTVFHVHTVSAELSFTAAELWEKGRIELPVGPKYLGCMLTVTKQDYLWFRQPLKDGEVAFEPENLGLPIHDWARMKLAWLEPGQTVSFPWTVPETGDYGEELMHLIAMAAPAYSVEKETQVEGVMPFTLLCDGEEVLRYERFYRFHDDFMQILEDDWKRLRLPAGDHILSLRNDHPEFCLAISRIVMKSCRRRHGQLSIPEWALKGETVTGKVFAVKEDVLSVSVGGTEITVSCQAGWNEISVCISEPGMAAISCGSETAQIEIIDCEEEAVPVKVGYDMTVVPHDSNGYMDWLLDYTQRTRLGNYIMFRSFHRPVARSCWERWGEYCRTHGLYVASCNHFEDGILVRAAGEKAHDFGDHEYPGRVYAFDPKPPYSSETMAEAAQHYMDFLKIKIDAAHKVTSCTAFGDASGGIRYSYLAGVDFVRAETMVGHTQTLLSQARPAAEALGNGCWGVHIAIQHGYQHYRQNHMGQYFLSLLQPWIMGAELIYEEDSLFSLFKEERQTWDDALTKGKRDMTRRFFKFVKTHPRQGKNVRSIAFLEGRYAAPFNGFICDVEQDPHYSVWGLFGSDDPAWGHGQPEKCRQILDVLMPGASTQPFRQRFDKRRFFFSGTPYGDFDCVPVEASNAYLSSYRLLLNLGWNTATEEDIDKLKAYVEQGGVLLTGIPQFSTHVRREFLKDFNDLSLINGGDLRELCGITVNGPGEEFCGQWNCKDRDKMPEPSLSAMPSDGPDEDGKALLADITLCGAEVVAWDSASGKPMLVRHKVGKGYVYTLTLWAYPGHERFQQFSAAWTAYLSGEAQDIRVDDPSQEVFWTVWEDGNDKTVMLLNTDWTETGNTKTVTLTAEGHSRTLNIQEQTLVMAKITACGIETSIYTL